MKTVNYNEKQVTGYLQEIARQMQIDDFRPDYIVGITRGGLIPAVMLSHYLETPMKTLNVSLRDGSDPETNAQMADDAYNGKKILIIDDINDSGETFAWIKDNWQRTYRASCATWNSTIWGETVRFASLITNEGSSLDVDYWGTVINKVENPEWCVFPWEAWWHDQSIQN